MNELMDRSGSTFVSDYIHNFSKKFHFDFEYNISKRNISKNHQNLNKIKIEEVYKEINLSAPYESFFYYWYYINY